MSKRKSSTLTKLESEVMGAIWDLEPNSASVSQVLDLINRHRKKKLAYNTVQTIFVKLKEKRAIKQVGTVGRAHQFQAVVSRESATTTMLGDFAERVFGGQLQPMIHQLIDDANLTQDELKQLRDWVDDKLRGDATDD